ncbi:BQ5605_C029g10682 [Microbotryum silenes-dioicae]|uniref:BQ5605_C029g10682 protein n=1 Tax=Microbotryum silenes-dioicae TaxID=796604 RepID=A0A2X0MLW6_9BASI|nr:BQ5605_C029g10682 [Microbotryum silenes-dioicae]
MQSWAARVQQHQLQHGSLEGAFSQGAGVKELILLIKADVSGTVEARAHHVEGYSRRNPLAKELSLQALLWPCDPNCNACSNGIRIKTC